MKRTFIAILLITLIGMFSISDIIHDVTTAVETTPTEESTEPVSVHVEETTEPTVVQQATTAPLLELEEETTPSVIPTEEPRLEPAENLELSLSSISKYTMSGFGTEYGLYRFNSPNDDIVVYVVSGSIYIVGEDKPETGKCYALIRMTSGKFIALSNNYLLFQTDDGKVAVEIERATSSLGTGYGKKYRFGELSEEEQASFVCPSVYEKVTQ